MNETKNEFGLIRILIQFYTHMNIAIVAATEMELELLRNSFSDISHAITYRVHGVGIMQATYHLQKLCLQKPDLIIQCGIAGTYTNSLTIGESVVVYSEHLGDTGAEDHDTLLDLFDIKLLDKHSFPFTEGYLLNESVKHFSKLKAVNGLTVNMASGNEKTIRLRQEKFHADIETMEGACLHYVCLQEHIPFMQFRGISNYVEPRDKNRWQIADALQHCQQEVITFIHQLPSSL